MARHPFAATVFGDHRFDDRVDDLAPSALAAERAHAADVARRAAALPAHELDRNERVTRALLIDACDETVEEIDSRQIELQSDGFTGYPITLLRTASRHEAPDADSAWKQLRRLEQLPGALDAAVEHWHTGAQRGWLPASTIVGRSRAMVEGYLAGTIDDDPFVHLTLPDDWEHEGRWREAAAQVVADVVRPAYQRAADALTELERDGRGDDQPGLCHLPGGDELYASSSDGPPRPTCRRRRSTRSGCTSSPRCCPPSGPPSAGEPSASATRASCSSVSGPTRPCGTTRPRRSCRWRPTPSSGRSPRRSTGSTGCPTPDAWSRPSPTAWRPDRRPRTTRRRPTAATDPASTSPTPTSPPGGTASRPRSSPSTKPCPATTSSGPAPPSSPTCTRSSGGVGTWPTAKAGASTPSAWPRRWVCTPRTRCASACCPPTPGARPGWCSTPASTPWPGPVPRRSTS